ncbi:MAG: DUF4271 domain-containing protein [Saprospiraceae bacterium]|nr:DUF4271 domain-containing protein [Saprospiraceae bacterium]
MTSHAQNPFEIKSRLHPDNVAAEKKEAITAQPSNDNPFELKRGQKQVIETAPTSIQPSDNSKKGINFPVNSPVPMQGGMLFGVTLLGLVPVTVFFVLFRAHFNRAYQNVLNVNTLKQSYREFKGTSVVPMNIWYLAFWVNAGIFLALVAKRFGISVTGNILLDAGLGIGAVSISLLLKHILNFIMGEIYPFGAELKLYNYLIMLFGIVLAVMLVPVNLVLAYAAPSITNILIFLTAIFLGLAFIFLAIRGIIIGNSYFFMHRFHFLLYICAMEIAPIFILVKLALGFINK